VFINASETPMSNVETVLVYDLQEISTTPKSQQTSWAISR